MKIFDMHVHCWHEEGDPSLLLERMERAGVYGGCVFSTYPKEYCEDGSADFDIRLKELDHWCSKTPDRLFPIVWIHPYEENIFENITKAVEHGVYGFKIICNNFYIYEDHCLNVLRHIASYNKPVFFHSGILWDGEVSSDYNRPLNFEALIKIEGLRFSMGHCSWPWIDECVALYGKFLNADNEKNAEMFFDLTPGTPEIYREDLFRKLFQSGYDTENNIMFGTDAYAHAYSSNWSKQWLEIDRKLMDHFGVSLRIREKIYADNLLRFLGISNTTIEHAVPSSDNAHVWDCENPEVKLIIKHWYEQLNLPKEYRWAFEKALATIPISDAIEIRTYDRENPDGKRNLLSTLFMCEQLKKRYEEKGIPEQILLDTLSDIGIWLDVWTDLKGELHLSELAWLWRHLDMRIFRLGRLQFCMAESEHDSPAYGLKKGDPVIEVHIPADGPLTPEECANSFALARAFFAKYYPDYPYRCFTCHSWLLDPTIRPFLASDSNILSFQKFFEIAESDPSNAILRYVFKWNTTARNIKYAPALSSFAATVKKAFISGTQFHETLGIMKI